MKSNYKTSEENFSGFLFSYFFLSMRASVPDSTCGYILRDSYWGSISENTVHNP